LPLELLPRETFICDEQTTISKTGRRDVKGKNRF
jgi:hypothetical protein